jgi:hypothetical protein
MMTPDKPSTTLNFMPVLCYILIKEEYQMINLKYTYEMDGDFFVGYLDDYPEFPTQGET